jgi:hypothetical protein
VPAVACLLSLSQLLSWVGKINLFRAMTFSGINKYKKNDTAYIFFMNNQPNTTNQTQPTNQTNKQQNNNHNEQKCIQTKN